MEESKLILMHRLGKLVEQLPDAIPVFNDMDEVRQRVLIDMAYNLGIAGLKKFRRMLAALERRDYEEAAKELLDSRYADQVKGRAVRNARMMETGEWENL
jgi:lysozyme